MSKPARRVLYLSFFLVFIILAPIFIAYSLGYRYRWDTRVIEKNGAFYIKSYPRDADIYINNQASEHQTPDQITEIRPGNYLLRVQKENYASWQKELKIQAGETTFAEDIVLFFSDIKKTNLGSGGRSWSANQTKNKYAYIDTATRHLYVTDLEQEKNHLIYTLDADYILGPWSPDDQKILLFLNQTPYIFDLNQKKIQALGAIQPLGNIRTKKILWDPKDAQLLWFLNDKQLYHYNLSITYEMPLSSLPLDKSINDFALYQDYLLIQYQETGEQKINWLAQLNKNNLQEIQKTSVDNLGLLHLLEADDRRFILTLGSTLYIKNQETEPIAIAVNLADRHDQRLLLSNGHEIILYNYQDDWQELIDRSTQIVSELIWHPNGSYFLSEINGQTHITEIDGRDHRNSLNILEDPLKKTYFFNKKGDKLFVLTPEENFYLTIQ